MAAPTKYKKEFCDIVVELGKQGYSIAMMASKIGVAKQSLYNYSAQYPEFLDAMRLSLTHAQSFHEHLQLEAVKGDLKDFNSQVHQLIMKNRFRDDYSDTSTQYVKQLESREDEVPDNKIEEIAKKIAEDYKKEYS